LSSFHQCLAIGQSVGLITINSVGAAGPKASNVVLGVAAGFEANTIFANLPCSDVGAKLTVSGRFSTTREKLFPKCLTTFPELCPELPQAKYALFEVTFTLKLARQGCNHDPRSLKN